MNQRIQDLAEQAEIYFSPSRIPETGFEYEGADISREDLQRFAELIMAECISACATDRLGKTVSAEELIKQHFGVTDV
jgi:hypothetical protein